MSNAGRHFLTFRLGAEDYGIELSRVQEIRSYAPGTPVPSAPRYVRGVMNLRGTALPIIDLGMKLGLPDAVITEASAVIVATAGAAKAIALLVDAVADVAIFTADAIPPDDGPWMVRRVLRGDGLVGLLDLERLVSTDESPALAGMR